MEKDHTKSKEQLISELAKMRLTVDNLTASQKELKGTDEKLKLLQEIILDICGEADALSAMHTVLKRICKVTGWVYGEIWRLSADDSFMERSPVWYSSSDILDVFGKASESFTFSPGEGLPGRVWSLKQPIWINDVTKDRQYLRAHVAEEVGFKTALGIPIISRNEVIAVMVFYLFEERAEDQHFVKLIFAVAAQLGPIMSNRQVADASKEDGARLTEILELTSDFVATADMDGKVLYCNKAARKMLGITDDEDISKIRVSDTFPDWSNKIICEEAIPASVLKGIWSGDTALLSRDGKEIPVSQIILAHKASDGKVKYLSTIARLTESKRSKEELLSLKKAVETMRIGITFADVNGNIIYSNPAEARMHGYEVEELIGKNVRIFAPSDQWNKLPANDLYEVGRESRNLRKDGSEFPVRLLSDSVTDSLGHVIGIVTSCEDLTELKKLEEELLKISKLESISTLSGGIAHDFNNILTVILGRISLAKMQLKPGDEIYENLCEAEKGCKRARDLTSQLLTFSMGGSPIKKVVQLPQLIKETAVLALSGSNIRVEYSFQNDLKTVEADESQMSQVINGMLINAVHAMPNGGIINVTAKNSIITKKDALPLKEGEYVVISIKDHGVGIPEEYLPRIFDPFFTTKQMGSGLGLATSYSIIRKHEGHITVKSYPGSGTVFNVYLPVSATKAEARIVKEIKSAQRSGKILLMDDEEVLRESTGDLLKHLGYEVECAVDGLEAVQKYRKAGEEGNPFDIVIMDLTVPGGMGGKDAIKRLLELDPGVKSIVSSGYSNDPIMADFRKFGFSGVVVKPYKIEELSETLDMVMAGNQ